MTILIVNVLMTNQPKEWNSVGYALWHNGKIYKFTAHKREISRAFFDLMVADYKRTPL